MLVQVKSKIYPKDRLNQQYQEKFDLLLFHESTNININRQISIILEFSFLLLFLYLYEVVADQSIAPDNMEDF